MELFDYIAWRWKSLAALGILGVVAIVLIGPGYGGRDYRAETELLVRPPANQINVYASNPDRYTNTQMTLLFSREYLEAEMVDSGATTARELGDALSFEHDTGSETVTLIAEADSAARAISFVNAAATGYLSLSQEQNLEVPTQSAQTLQDEIIATQADLATAGEAVKRATFDYLGANPLAAVPPASSIAPQAAEQQALSSNRLQNLLQQQTQLELTVTASASRSSVLKTATEATGSSGWNLITYVAAGGGLLIALLVLAGVGLALTTRILSQARWNDATADSDLGPTVRMTRLGGAGRRRSARRVLEALRPEDGGKPTVAAYLPERSKGMRRRASRLFKELESHGITVREVASLGELSPSLAFTGAEESKAAADLATDDTARVLLLVDLVETQLDDVSVLRDHPAALLRRTVPVLL